MTDVPLSLNVLNGEKTHIFPQAELEGVWENTHVFSQTPSNSAWGASTGRVSYTDFNTRYMGLKCVLSCVL